jgi:chromosome segregation ATPase
MLVDAGVLRSLRSILAGGTVKKLVIHLLSTVGLAPARSVWSQAQLIADAKAGSLAWKMKAGEAAASVKSLEAEVKRQEQLIHRLTASNEKLRQQQDEVEHRLNARLTEAEQALTVAREYLMAIDVKLDILEGAANVLDTRTRTASSKQHSGITAAV